MQTQTNERAVDVASVLANPKATLEQLTAARAAQQAEIEQEERAQAEATRKLQEAALAGAAAETTLSLASAERNASLRIEAFRRRLAEIGRRIAAREQANALAAQRAAWDAQEALIAKRETLYREAYELILQAARKACEANLVGRQIVQRTPAWSSVEPATPFILAGHLEKLLVEVYVRVSSNGEPTIHLRGGGKTRSTPDGIDVTEYEDARDAFERTLRGDRNLATLERPTFEVAA